jgi:MFS family permease
MLFEILRGDPDYRSYMFWMGMFGAGGLMLTSQLIVVLSDHSDIPPAVQILMLAVVPLVALPLCVPFWARMFDGQHIVAYRSRQAWALVAGSLVTVSGALVPWTPALWIGAALLGFAYAGANLGWNLGHGDFATPGRAQHYMGVHVTLTGVRGMLAPPAGMLVYQGLEQLSPGLGRWSLLLPLALLIAGASGFNAMRRAHARRESSTPGAD